MITHNSNIHISEALDASKNINRWTLIVMLFVIICFFRLTTPFEFSTSPILRTFTLAKTTTAIFIVTLILVVFKIYRNTYTEHASLLILLLLLVSMSYSTLGSEDMVVAMNVLQNNIISIMMYFVIIYNIQTLENLKKVLLWLMFFGFIFVFINEFKIVRLEDLLSQSNLSSNFEDTIRGQSTFDSTYSNTRLTRRTFLWFDANNFGYVLVTLILINLYFIFYMKKTKYIKILLYVMLFTFIVNLITTISRGSTASILVSSITVIAWFRNVRNKKINLLYIILLSIVIVSVISLPFVHILDELKDRILLGFGLFGYKDTQNITTGLEDGRMLTLYLAWKEFTMKPLFGWGGQAMGHIGETGNHMFYVNMLGQWGIAGTFIYMSLIILIIASIIKAINKIKLVSDELHGMGVVLVGIIIVTMIKGFFAPGEIYFVGGLAMVYANCILLKPYARINNVG